MSSPNSVDASRDDLPTSRDHEPYLRTLYQISSDTGLSFDEKVRRLLELGCEYFGVGVGMLTHEQKDSFEIEIMHGSHPELDEGTLTPPMTDNYCRRVVSDGRTICVDDAGEAGWQDDSLYHEFGLACYAGAEVTAGNERYGTICFTDLSPRERPFTETEQTFLEFMGQSVSYELERKQRINHLTALNTVSRELMDMEAVDAVSEHVAETAETTLDLPVTAVVLYDDQTGELEPVAQTETASKVLRATSLLRDGDGPAWEAFTEGETRRSDLPAEADVPVHPPVTEVALFPLGDHGVFLAGSTATDGFASAEFDFAETVAMNTKSALDQAENKHRLHRQNERLESFSSMLAHELRNPLMIAQIYHRRAVDGSQVAAEEVNSALDRMEDMIDALLVIARGNDSVDDWDTVALPNAVTDAWTDVTTDAAQLVIETNRSIRTDRTHVQHLFRNLFKNSVEHGDGEVSIRVGDLEDGFFVEDDGPGIPPDDREDVFETGYTTGSTGVGLGLALVGELAEMYDWDCDVTASDDGGTRVEFRDVPTVSAE